MVRMQLRWSSFHAAHFTKLTLYISVFKVPSASCDCLVREYLEAFGDFKSLSLGQPLIVFISLPFVLGVMIVDFVTIGGSLGPG